MKILRNKRQANIIWDIGTASVRCLYPIILVYLYTHISNNLKKMKGLVLKFEENS